MKRSPFRRTTRLPRVNRARKNAAWTRAYGSAERVAFVAALPCACGCGRGPCENAHVVKGDGGGSYKASARYIAPLAPGCHRLLHQIGPVAFQCRYDVDLAAVARATERRWQARAA